VDVEKTLSTVSQLPDESTVRRTIAELNCRIELALTTSE
jgi:hypothetical protein